MIPLAAFAAAMLAAADAPAAAQSLVGTVEMDGRPVAGAPVEVHRVTRSEAGVVAEVRTGADGRFRVALPPPDTAGFTVYFATAVHLGVRYFGPALHPGEDADGYRIVAYDTTSAGPAADALRIARRDVFMIPGVRGGWEVAELVRVRNPGDRTVVSEDAKPVFGIPVPPDAVDFEAGEGDVTGDRDGDAAAEVVLMGGRVLATVPLVPGERDFFFRYRLPPAGRTLPLPVDRATDTLMVYVRQPGPQIHAQGLGDGRIIDAEGEQYLRFQATALAPGAPVVLRWRNPAAPPVDPRLAAGLLAGAVLAAGAVVAVRRRRPGIGPPG